jgi:4-deoxy-L-threo-5-hexosulose-uronate ketol-isomerase
MLKMESTKLQFTKIETPRAADLNSLNSACLRASFLIESLFQAGEARLFLTDLDRLVVGGISPVEDFVLPPIAEFGRGAFAERREIGVINIGDPASITAGAMRYSMGSLECLYIGRGESNVIFHAAPTGQAAYYFLSCPAHAVHPTRKATMADARIIETGTAEGCSRRKIFQYIYPGGIASAQLVMGFTQLEPGSAWNTMPPHTHHRRTEIYFYFDLGDNMLVHLLGEPNSTRHLIVHDRETVLSPSWSIHSGVGTGNYRFIWGMAGENQEFEDMDPVTLAELA